MTVLALPACGYERSTCVDLVQRHAQPCRKLLLHVGARLVLGQKMLLEDVVLVLGQARLDIAARLLGHGRCGRRGAGGVHGAARSDGRN